MSEKKMKKYWKGLEELEETDAFLQSLEKEFPEPLPLDALMNNAGKSRARVSRRSFLRASGFTVAAAVLSACSRGKVEKAIPLLNRAEEAVPGKSFWYATTCHGCNAGCGLLVKNRDGRPIKIEGNPQHPLSRGGVCAIGQATVLELYDSKRPTKPLLHGKSSDLVAIDRFVSRTLQTINEGVYFLTGTQNSPTTRHLIRQFLQRFKNSRHIQFDALSWSAILDAHQQTHGRRVLPQYRFNRADLIVSFDADFLGTWISPVSFTRDYVQTREPKGDPPHMSYHVQFEGRLSLTGSRADTRYKTTPEEIKSLIAYFARKLAEKAGISFPDSQPANDAFSVDRKEIDALIERLWAARGRSLVVCGLNDLPAQILINAMNHWLNNYEKTLSIQQPSNQSLSNDADMQHLLGELKAGRVKALFIAGVNPLYSLPHSDEILQAFKNVPLTVTFSEYVDETAAQSAVFCPLPHALEVWADNEPVNGVLSLTQPLIKRLAERRSLNEYLAAWMGEAASDYEIIKQFWQEHLFPLQKKYRDFQAFWDESVQKGFALVDRPLQSAAKFNEASLGRWQRQQEEMADQTFTLVLYPKISMLDGRHARNPWLQELPDPISKAVWDNYVCLAPATARAMNLEQGDVVEISDGHRSLELPVLLQPGQHEKLVAIAVGYGCRGTERFSEIGPDWILKRPTVKEGQPVGRNAFPLAHWQNGYLTLYNRVQLRPTGKKALIAQTQTYHNISVPEELGGERRDLVRETTLDEYRKDPAAGNKYEHRILQLWPEDHVYTGHHWAMVIDLNKCTGCSSCVISCQAENNVPVVGKDEVYRRREMHWIRIDRYYSGDESDPEVLFQPVMCQHCDHAPCEGVCPVLATLHSDEGINQQIYNRCVGTRYCANNCPYKVRRFNWFNYWQKDRQENLVLNPDITVRSRGVMEKCSLCVQRIQEAKAEAKRQGKTVQDGDIKLACEQSCPAEAIVFGDMNDPQSRVSRLIHHPRHYNMLEEMNFLPTVGYMTMVRNKQKQNS